VENSQHRGRAVELAKLAAARMQHRRLHWTDELVHHRRHAAWSERSHATSSGSLLWLLMGLERGFMWAVDAAGWWKLSADGPCLTGIVQILSNLQCVGYVQVSFWKYQLDDNLKEKHSLVVTVVLCIFP